MERNRKRARDSHTMMIDIVFPPDTNHLDTMFGGKVMAVVDRVANIAAMRHARRPVVTVSTDRFNFLCPIKTGEAIIVEAFVTWTGTTSLEVYTKVEAENLLTGERRLASHAHLTFVALDENGNKVKVPQVIPETDEEIQQYKEAQARYERRKNRRR
ncbi:acyl-CoA thioesterase [Aneurinibacillus aneurinilyticus]|uniref:Thioesterase family protein n=1 Tax=Aneurinibacillus aneurinilyticus ATCC 12856 TaxID=649747 RepID=U1Y009_ANEAE|nr:acyl-CoA thioesterase [Aneurinibacillus aneurinilyticus]ERI04316.1 thioesterase family protein [Aneurinibacillus aneurinilyticus ATCC 12856]MCI1692796.1 acyl-CoA thioesterase [Aneurinibacillus aneurinilyticus]MED0668851.1 acyl-CoA thioesterase [Aneurinibacillus aneurinilyticus]MED0708302.1 acyl-CoA thioesterase [Aneurinibacillus aneurinilyticus]MED0722110.1 acyl-CoA thioesterase [Aneurinibacillus aneurinilyticus]